MICTLQIIIGERRSPKISLHNQVQSKILTKSRQVRSFGKSDQSLITIVVMDLKFSNAGPVCPKPLKMGPQCM